MNNVHAQEPFHNVEAVIEYIRSFTGKPEDLNLKISDKMNDSIGVNMAIITDAILAKGFEPNGFIQKKGYKIYLYRTL